MAEDEVTEALRREADEVEEYRRRFWQGTPGDDWESEEMRRRA